MKCFKCKFKKSKVFDVRKYQTFILRSRRCYRCRHEWKTQEVPISFDDFAKLSYDKELNKSKFDEYNHTLFDNQN